MTLNSKKLTKAYQKARLANRDKALGRVIAAFNNLDKKNMTAGLADFNAVYVSEVYEANKTDEELTGMYHLVLSLFETGEAHPDFQLDDKALKLMGFGG